MKISKSQKAQAEAKMYNGLLPIGAQIVGTVKRSDGEAGALLKLQNGIYVQSNAGVFRTLDQRVIARLLERSRAASIMGAMRSDKKTAAARRNAKRGGWPKGKKRT